MNDDKSAQRLIDAIKKNDIATASSLISSGLVNFNVEPWPLQTAAGLGRLEIMTMLLDAGANIDLCEYGGWTACHDAIHYNQFDALTLLVERGAKLTTHSMSMLAVAARKYSQSDQIINYLLDAGAPLDDLTPFEMMSLVRSVALYKRLLARGVNFNGMRDEYSCTLCHHVAERVTDENNFRFLVDVCGADSVNDVNDGGQTPLHTAVNAQNIAAMRVLIELGANIDQQDNDGRTVLHMAAAEHRRASLSSLNLLLAVGVDVHLANNDGQTAFDFALHRRNTSAFALLIAAGGGLVELDRLNDNGRTLRRYAKHRNVELPTADEIDAARRRFAKTRLDLARRRAAEICIGLQQLDLNALQLCEIMMHSFGALRYSGGRLRRK